MNEATYDKFPAETFKDITFKKVIFFPSRDGGGLDADVYFKGKIAAKIHDDGNGGEIELTPTFDTKKKEVTNENFVHLLNYIKEKNLAKVLHENGWDFMEVDRIDASSVLDSMITAFKMHKDFVRDQKQKIIFSDSGKTYTIKLSYPIEKIPTQQLRAHVLSIATKYKKGKDFKILNTNLRFDPNTII
jgi:hypothetical protein